MPTPNIPEGFYWVRVVEHDPAPFVAHRFASTWFAPGIEKAVDGRGVEVLSERLPPPAFDTAGKAIESKPLPKPTRPQLPRSMRREVATGRSPAPKALKG